MAIAGNQMAGAELLYGADSTTIHREFVLGIVHLNFDCYADSVIGTMNDEFSYVPRFIVLAAELGHAYNADRGEINTEAWFKTEEVIVRKEEKINHRDIENVIRQD